MEIKKQLIEELKNNGVLIKETGKYHKVIYIHENLNTIVKSVENLVKKLNIHDVSDTLISWEQFKKKNWYESEAIDVEKLLMHQYKEIYGR